MPTQIKLIVGLGNPGSEYTETRHNAGFWFVERLIARHDADFSAEKKFYGETARFSFEGNDYRVLKPDTFMNHSGRAVRAITDYYGIGIDEVLVAHDEIDLEPGTVRIKKAGGHGGHNGLRDIMEQTAEKEFFRLRIGVGHPGHKDDVVHYVLNRPGTEDKKLIDESIDRAVGIMPVLFRGEHNKAMTLLNSSRPGAAASNQAENDN